MKDLLKFSKYHGCGNDFILIDNQNGDIRLSEIQINNLCHRRFGIGADGLMVLSKVNGFDFEMKYYNSDGKASSFCGNGGRSIVKFAQDLGILKSKFAHFRFEDQDYTAEILENGHISLSMIDVKSIENYNQDYFLYTGSPHYIHFTDNIDDFDIIPFARSIRYSEKFPEGINVNIVEKTNDGIKMRTYERGVEDETYSCGTGVTAAAITYHKVSNSKLNSIKVKTIGGDFEIKFEINNNIYQNIKLIGPAEFVFEGEILI